MNPDDPDIIPVPKKKGWPKGRPRLAKSPIVQTEPKAQVAPSKPGRATPNWLIHDVTAASDNVDQLAIPADQIPEGYAFQWVTREVYGQEQPRQMARFTQGGWTPVHNDDFEGRFAGRWNARESTEVINYGGLMLMYRPMDIHQRALQREKSKAEEAVEIKRRQLTGGDLPGVTLDSGHVSAIRSNKINRTVERLTVPED